MDLLPLGIDVSKQKLHLCLLLSSGKARTKSLPNSDEGMRELTVWLAKQLGNESPGVHACLEATGAYSDLAAERLHEAGLRVSLVNPKRISAYAESELVRTKNDQSDAALIARFCQAQRPEPWSPPAPEVRQLQSLMRRLDSLSDLRQQEANRLETASGQVAESVRLMLEHLDREIKRVKALIGSHIDAHPELRRRADLLESIPGVGALTAAWLLAELPPSLEDARQAAAYAGLVPKERQSGTSVRGRTRLSKQGNARLRKALYMPALSAMRYNPVVRSFCASLHGRGKAKMAVVGAAMRKLLHIAFGVLKNGLPFDPYYSAAA